MKKGLKVGLIGLVLLAVVVTAGFLVWTQVARYKAFPEVSALITPEVKSPRGWYVFKSAQPSTQGFIFYPGAKVEASAYAPLMKAIADQDITAIIAPMPLDLAIFGIGKANQVIAAYPEIKTWIIGGHSLGGSMAAQYVRDNPTRAQGTVLMGSYPGNNVDLSKLPIKIVSICGDHDGLVTDAKIQHALPRLPPDTQVITLQGGNHAQFGNYGPQVGDGVATMSREAQQPKTVEAIAALLKQISISILEHNGEEGWREPN